MTRQTPILDRAKAWQYIKGNITCMWTQPENGKYYNDRNSNESLKNNYY